GVPGTESENLRRGALLRRRGFVGRNQPDPGGHYRQNRPGSGQPSERGSCGSGRRGGGRIGGNRKTGADRGDDPGPENIPARPGQKTDLRPVLSGIPAAV